MRKTVLLVFVSLLLYKHISADNAQLAPTNDDCSGATLITAVTGACLPNIVGDVTGATQSIAPITVNNRASSVANDVWFSFVATKTRHLVNLSSSSSFDAVVSMYDSCGGNFIGSADANGAGVGESFFAGKLTMGSTYYIRVYHFGNTIPSTTTFSLCIGNSTLPPPPPSNDFCLGAYSAAVATTTVSCIGTSVSTFYSSVETYSSSCWNSGSFDDGVWYSFTATATSAQINISNQSAGLPVGWSLFTGSCSALSEIACNAGGNSIVSGLSVGQKYYICVFYQGVNIEGTFDLCVVSSSSLGEENNESNEMILYPNPTNGTVTFNLTTPKESVISVYTLTGQQIIEVPIFNSLTIDMSNYENGVYFVQLRNEKEVYTKRISKQ